MSYTDKEIILDRQTLIRLAEDKSYSNHSPYGGALKRHKLMSLGICTFEFDAAVVWDDGKEFKKLKGLHMIELKITGGFKIPNQSPFQHCRITVNITRRF